MTAQRREQNLQDVPIAIDTFNSEIVEKRRISDFQGLSFSVPSFSINSLSKSRLNPALRGGSSSLVSAGAEQAVGLFIDDQYFGGAGDFELDLFDIERIEVLRGPQGTLFGRNTTGGSINVVTRRPADTIEGKFEATFGNYNAIEARGHLSGPLAESLYGSLALSSRSRDGTSRNQTTGVDVEDLDRTSARAKLLWEVSEDMDVTATIGYSHSDELGIARDSSFSEVPTTNQDLIDIGFVPDDDTRVIQQAGNGKYDSEQWTANLRGEYRISNATLLSITTYRDFDSYEGGNSLLGVPVPSFDMAEPRTVESFSQEFRYMSDYGGRFNWVGGLYYFDSDESRSLQATTSWDEQTFGGAFQSITFCPLQDFDDFENGIVTPACFAAYPELFGPNEFSVNERNRTRSYSVYADGNYELFDGLTIFGGVRYTEDEKKFNAEIGGGPDFVWNPPTSTDIDPGTGLPVTGQSAVNKARWDEVTYRVGIQYEPIDNVMFYGSRATGFRSGVFDAAQSDPNLVAEPVAPESALSHELGVKSRIFDNRVQLNITLFDVEYTDLQFFVGNLGNTLTTNAGEASVRGVEVQLDAAVTDYLTIFANYSHQDGTSSDIPLAAEIPDGTPPQGTIPNTYMLALDLDVPFGNGHSLNAYVDYTRKDRYNLEFSAVPQFESVTNSLVNANVAFRHASGWEVSLWGQNLSDEDIVIYGNDLWFAFYDGPTTFSNLDVITATSMPRYSAPRTYGVTVRYSF